VRGIKSGDRPLLVWIADPVLDAAAEHRAFDDSDVRLASKAFRLARITPAEAQTDPILAAYARSAPALLAFAPDLTRATISYGATIDPRAVLAASRGFASTYLHIDLDASVSRARTLLVEMAALTDERAKLAGPAPADSDLAARKARVAEIDARLAQIPAIVDGLFHTHAS
jgi:hypothetical protein